MNQGSEFTGDLEQVQQEDADAFPLRPIAVTIDGVAPVHLVGSRAGALFSKGIDVDPVAVKLLSADQRRRSAQILTSGQAVYIATDQASANQGVGVVLPPGILLPFTATDELWARVAAGVATVTVPAVTVGTDPAAGSEVSVTVPAGEQWELEAVRLQLVTSAVVATRRVVLVIDDGAGNILAEIATGFGQTATLTTDYTYTHTGYETTGTRFSNIQQGLPRMLLAAGYRIITVTDGLDPGDNYAPPIITYRKTSAPTTAVVSVISENWAD
jgi:hypothetical protein